MSSPDKRSIIVRVEVEIPESGTVTTGERRGRPKTYRIDIPSATAPVKVRDSGGGFGFICATGNSTNDQGVAARTVFVQVFPAGTTTFPAAPPPGTTGTIPAANGDWSFSGAQDIPGAAHNAAGTAGNVLCVWADFGTGPYEIESRPFTGLTSNGTDCIPGSGGSGSGGSGGSGSGSGSFIRFPREWRVVGEGFSGELSAFNVASLLQIHTEPSGENVWSNKGDGKTATAIELYYIARDRVWGLVFYYQSAKARYTALADNWNPLNANMLSLDAASAGAAEAPHTLLITPV